jgi:hypothetical protein
VISDRKGYVQRQLELLKELLAAVFKRSQEAGPQEARRVLAEGCQALLGMDFQTLLAVDAASCAQLLASRQRVEAFAELVELDGTLLMQEGRTADASERQQHARQLRGL